MAAPIESKKKESKDFPIKNKQIIRDPKTRMLYTAFEINSNHTEVVCSQFEDRTFIIVTQYNKIGTLVKVSQDSVVDASGERVSMISTDVLMGVDEPITHVVAKNLVGQLNIKKPIVLSMALKDNSPKTVKAIAQIIPTLW